VGRAYERVCVPLLSTGRGGSSVVRRAETCGDDPGTFGPRRDGEGRSSTSLRSGLVTCRAATRGTRGVSDFCVGSGSRAGESDTPSSSVEVRGPLLSGCYVFCATHGCAQWLFTRGLGLLLPALGTKDR